MLFMYNGYFKELKSEICFWNVSYITLLLFFCIVMCWYEVLMQIVLRTKIYIFFFWRVIFFKLLIFSTPQINTKESKRKTASTLTRVESLCVFFWVYEVKDVIFWLLRSKMV